MRKRHEESNMRKEKEVKGVVFTAVAVIPESSGWVQWDVKGWTRLKEKNKHGIFSRIPSGGDGGGQVNESQNPRGVSEWEKGTLQRKLGVGYLARGT